MKSKRILIVEDDADLRENITEYLSFEEFSVNGAGCALDFYKMLSSDDFDVAIVDIGLPDLSGFEIVEHLRRHTELGIIILTARDAMIDKMRGFDCGADYYFIKPVDSRELTASINNLLNRLGKNTPEEVVSSHSFFWLLDISRWVLLSPEGVQVELNAKEYRFLQILTEEKGKPVPRQVLLGALGYNTKGPYGNRAMDVLISRLRKKIMQTTQQDAPIKTVQSVGYVFISPVQHK